MTASCLIDIEFQYGQTLRNMRAGCLFPSSTVAELQTVILIMQSPKHHRALQCRAACTSPRLAVSIIMILHKFLPLLATSSAQASTDMFRDSVGSLRSHSIDVWRARCGEQDRAYLNSDGTIVGSSLSSTSPQLRHLLCGLQPIQPIFQMITPLEPLQECDVVASH